MASLLVVGLVADASGQEPPRTGKAARDGGAGNVPAFPGALGYGAGATGGRGGKILKVTSLADSGPGSLRWALGQSGPRIILFGVSGIIQLQSQILVDRGDLTIAGQTSPGEGITIQGSRIRLKASNIIVRGLHMRPGDGPGTDPGDRDGMMIGTTDLSLHDIIVDHCSFTWAIDENLTINGDVHDVTLSNNIVAEGLSHSLHPKGEHSKGLLVSNWSGLQSDRDSRISILRNLLASNSQRNPEIRAGQDLEIINNLSYNYGLSHKVFAIGGGSKGVLTTTAYIVGNVIKPGPSSPNHKVPIFFDMMGDGSAILLYDNLWTKLGTKGLQDQKALYWDGGGARYVTIRPYQSARTQILRSEDVMAHVLANAGTASYSKNSVDARIVREAATGAGSIIDSPKQVGGLANLIAAKATPDSDGDGLPDWFEDKYGLDKHRNDASDRAGGSGYTNIERYINGIISGFAPPS